MLGSTTDPGPGPAPPPSLTLPPLRELDKAITSEPHMTSDLYMSSSSAPSTTTTSSLSRADSLSSMEYLQGMHHLHGHNSRQLPGAGGGGSTTTGSTTGSSYGYGSGSSGSTTSGVHNLHSLHHHSAGLGRANLNAAIHHQQQQRQPQDPGFSSNNNNSISASPRTPVAAGEGINTNATNSKSGSASGSAGTEPQGRNSTKRAAQNRAAQRAFRQRKDLYVRELERKAELLQQAEGRIMQLSARNKELEAALASQGSSPSSSASAPSSQHPPPPPPQNSSPATASGPAGATCDQDRETIDRDREWNRDERPPIERRGSHDAYENRYHSRPPMTRYASTTQLQHNYNNSSPLLASGSIRHQSLYRQRQRPESDYEFDSQDNNPREELHRRPSESSLKAGQRESNSADSEDYGAGRASHYTRGGSNESNNQHARGGHQSSSVASEYADLPPSPSSSQQHPGGQHSTSLNERPPLYPVSTQGTRSGVSSYSDAPSAGSRSYQNEDSVKPHSPSTAVSPMPTASGGMVAATSLSKSGAHPSIRAEMEYLSDERSSEPGSGYDGMRKRPSDGSISWTSSASGGGGYETSYASRAFPDHIHGEVRKQASWSSFAGTRNRPTLPNAPPTSSPMRDTSIDMDTQDSYHQQHPEHRTLHHRASTGSVSIRDSERQQPREMQNRMMMSDSPEMRPLDTRFGNPVSATGNTSPQIPRHQQSHYFSPIGSHQQQQQRRGLPQSPGQEYPPGSYVNSPRSHIHQPPYRQGQQGSMGPIDQRHPDSSDMEAVYDERPRNSNNNGGYNDNGGGYNEASMGSP
ncbi:hypothetical protein BGZ46_007846 [Entomortierella lignicola]|nr:hypothetical protein BGZ46_007846 [Entomortierella lignicola]